MKRILVTIVLFVGMCCAGVMAQTVDEIKADTSYVYGEGDGSTERLADRRALEEILQQIQMKINHESEIRIANEQTGAETANTSIKFESVMNTYSTATLTNTHKLMLENGPTVFRVFRYVKKSEIDRIFNSRKERVKEYVQTAHQALQQMQINDALRYYYWADVLAQSLRYPEDMKISDEAGNEHTAIVWIPQRMNDIFRNLTMDILKKEGNEYEMGFFYKRKPVATLGFTYFDGKDWSCETTATDGKGVMEMQPGFTPEYFQVRYEYEYRGEAQCDKEVQMLLDSMVDNPVAFPKAQVSLPVDKRINEHSAEYAALTQLENTVPQLESSSLQVTTDKCDSVMRKVITSIRTKKYDDVRSFFTEEGYDVFTRLINYGNGRIVGGEPKLNYSTLFGDTYCRSVPMNFTFSKNRKFVEDVVFVFNEGGLIDNVSFSLGKVATNDILGNAEGWSVEAKNVLINFLETYKTAYGLKRADYLNSIFADDALIITGKVVTKSTRKLDGMYSNNRYIKLNKQSKKQYIENLRRMFKSREYVNIKFANNDVKKMGKGGEVYSIQIKQDFFSDTYGDSGYLFILVDLNKPDEPTIRVRAWQEFPDPEWGIFGPDIL